MVRLGRVKRNVDGDGSRPEVEAAGKNSEHGIDRPSLRASAKTRCLQNGRRDTDVFDLF
jgi:hypothetical protein